MKFTLESPIGSPEAKLFADSLEASLSQVIRIDEATGLCLTIKPFIPGKHPVDPTLNASPFICFSIELLNERGQDCLIPASRNYSLDGFAYRQSHPDRKAATIERRWRLESTPNETMPDFLARLAGFVADILKEGQTVQTEAAA